MEMLDTVLLNNSLQKWLIAVFIAIAFVMITWLIRCLSLKHLNKHAEDAEGMLLPVLVAMVKRTKWLFMLIVGIYLGSIVLSVPEHSRRLLNSMVIVTLLLQAGLWARAAMLASISQYHRQQVSKDPASVTTLNVIDFIGRVVVWAIVVLLVLDNLGVNITALIAGLGVGGVAVALALQTILGDLFASLSIVLDKPFVVGDFLIVGDLMGSVEYVGLKTTRLRSLSGEQLVFSNSDLLNSRIRNYGRMFERRVPFNIGVIYQTPRDKLILIPRIIQEAIEQQDKTRFDRSHFQSYGDSALIFESVYYVLGPDYNEYMDIQQAINLHIYERFEQEGIEFAYPTQTLYLHNQ